MAKIYYSRVDEFWRKGEKYTYLEEREHVGNVEWQELQPDAKHNWLTEGLRTEFESFIPAGTKEAKQAASQGAKVIFKNFSTGLKTARDAVVYNFDEDVLLKSVERFCDSFNAEVFRYQQKGKPSDVDSFLAYDTIKWSRNLKRDLTLLKSITCDKAKIRVGAYRPFTKEYLYFDDIIVDELGRNGNIFPTPSTENENLIISLAGVGDRKGFGCLVTSKIASLDFAFEKAQCFPFYTYNEDGTNRRENITDWALEKFRKHYKDSSITKWDIFHYVYALLHHAVYRERYAANLKRELPRIPFAPDFRAFADAGARLAEIHVHYEQQPEYPLERIEQPGVALNWRVERMKLDKDKGSLHYNEFLTLARLPPEAFEYRLGNRSALEWVIDQYRTTTDNRSGITNDPNRADDPSYIIRLVGQVITVSLETVKIVRSLPTLGIEKLQEV